MEPPMYEEKPRMSLTEGEGVIEQEDVFFMSGEFGAIDAPGGLLQMIPSKSELSATYTWTLNLQKQEQKIVSLPFGPRDWAWQAIIYPQGTGQEGFMSAFIRPILNQVEIAMGDQWERPVTLFSFRVKGQEDILFESEPTFQQFSKQDPGWGFPEFLNLPLSPDVIQEDGTTVIEIQVFGPSTVNKCCILYQEKLSDQLPQETLSFGPSSCSWKLLIDQGLYLSPVLSDFELSLGDAFSRSISALTVKLLDPITKEAFESKSLTGGFLFDKDNLKAGWDTFTPVWKQCIVHCKIVWDPLVLSKATASGKLRQHISKQFVKLQSQSIYQTQILELEQKNQEYQSVLEQTEQQMVQYEQQALRYEQQLQEREFLFERNQELELRLQQLGERIQSLRSQQNQWTTANVKLKKVKHDLVRIRSLLDQTCEKSILVDQDPLEQQLMDQKLINADLEVRLAQALAQLNFVDQKEDEQLFERPMSPEEKMLTALESARLELQVGQQTYDELNARLLEMTPDSPLTERMALIAELNMVICGLDVANASLHEAAERTQVPQDFEMTRQELGNMIYGLQSLRRILENEPFLSEYQEYPQEQVQEIVQETVQVTEQETVVEKLFEPKSEIILDKMDRIMQLLNTTKGPSVEDAEPWSDTEPAPEEKPVSLLAILLLLIFGFYGFTSVVCDPKTGIDAYQPVCEHLLPTISMIKYQAKSGTALAMREGLPFLLRQARNSKRSLEYYSFVMKDYAQEKWQKAFEKKKDIEDQEHTHFPSEASIKTTETVVVSQEPILSKEDDFVIETDKPTSNVPLGSDVSFSPSQPPVSPTVVQESPSAVEVVQESQSPARESPAAVEEPVKQTAEETTIDDTQTEELPTEEWVQDDTTTEDKDLPVLQEQEQIVEDFVESTIESAPEERLELQQDTFSSVASVEETTVSVTGTQATLQVATVKVEAGSTAIQSADLETPSIQSAVLETVSVESTILETVSTESAVSETTSIQSVISETASVETTVLETASVEAALTKETSAVQEPQVSESEEISADEEPEVVESEETAVDEEPVALEADR
ncbi:hypothetical protein EDD86DRAFT_258697 [Gorgonomyces haynaldii]|nr:hypothetical protein EDD86DRAFT_258697 [Gorgonomyces haynaldii]